MKRWLRRWAYRWETKVPIMQLCISGMAGIQQVLSLADPDVALVDLRRLPI